MNDNFITTDGNHNILELNLTVLIIQEGNFFIAYCPTLNLSSYGDSVAEARQGFQEVMQAYIEDTQEMNSLRKDLVRHGWQLHSMTEATPPDMADIPEIPSGLLKGMYQDKWQVPVC